MKLVIFGVCLLFAGCFAQGEDPPPDLPVAPDAPVEFEEEPTEAPYVDPCENVTCPRMQHCEDDDRDGKGECVCNTYCDSVPDRTRYQVCSNQAETFPSLCAMEREKCLCEKGHSDCKKSERKSAELDYYGACSQGRGDCTSEDMDSFMERMFRWYPLALYDRARVGQLSGAEVTLARRVSRSSLEDQYSLSSQWLFCNFDTDDDGTVTREESLILTAQLHPLESCGPKFIKECDSDSDKQLSFSEWQGCLNLEADEKIDLCSDLAKQNANSPRQKK